jgi:hypothetical protein
LRHEASRARRLWHATPEAFVHAPLAKEGFSGKLRCHCEQLCSGAETGKSLELVILRCAKDLLLLLYKKQRLHFVHDDI